MSPRPVQPRLPCQPLLDAIGAENHGHAARLLGVTRRTVIRWLHGGVPVDSAERYATARGLHPSTVWPDAYEDAQDALSLLHQQSYYKAYALRLVRMRAYSHRQRQA